MRELVPELPHEKAARYQSELGLTRYDASVLSSDQALASFFDSAADAHGGTAKKLANFIINNLVGALNDRELSIESCPLPAASAGSLVGMVEDGKLANNQARDVLAALLDSDDPAEDPAAVAKRLGFEPADSSEIDAIIDDVIAANPDKVAEIKAGNDKLANWLTGQVMKASRGKANPKQVTDSIRAKLA
jgi:aspartyl-tRNA(Asn)/glutamyl-tRNA(Gln) amidotransferase subunit B